jgi:hypothetical protein
MADLALTVVDVPLQNQVIPQGLSHFRKGVSLSSLLSAMPEADRPSRSYHNPKILQILKILRYYVSVDTDLHKTLPLSSLKRNKVIWVSRSDARRVLKDRADAILPLTDEDQVDGVNFPPPIGSREANQDPAAYESQTVSEPADMRILSRVSVSEEERFVNSEGEIVPITLCGDHTYEGIRFFIDDIYDSCQLRRGNIPGTDVTGIVVENVIVDCLPVRVVDFRNALRLFAHFDRNGSSFAMSVMDWCARVIHSVQYGDADAPRPQRLAAHMRTVAGRSMPDPMADCDAKMLYMETLGDVETLKETWPALAASVPAGGNNADYFATKLGEGSGHRFGDNARAAIAVHAGVQPECYDFRPTPLSRRSRIAIESAFAEKYAECAVPTDPECRFSGDTEIFLFHRDQLRPAWKYVQREMAVAEEDISSMITTSEVSDLKHQLEVSELKAQNKQLRGTIGQMNVAVYALPTSAQARFNSIMRVCEPS